MQDQHAAKGIINSKILPETQLAQFAKSEWVGFQQHNTSALECTQSL